MKLSVANGRSVEEWVGKTPDTAVPDRVRLRVLLRYDRKCYLTGKTIRPGDEWDLEDIVALTNGGQNRESNKAPALKAPHKIKTGRDRKIKAKTDRTVKKHYGIVKPKRPPSRFKRRMDGTVVD